MMSAKRANLRRDDRAAFRQRSGANREIGFWVLLFGSWMTLNSPAWPNQLLGGFGTAAFLVLAFGSLGKLRSMGMEFVDWAPAQARFWYAAAALGVAAGSTGLVLAHLAHSRINVAENWRVFLLQAALGPVLEEILFRGYLVRLLLWMLKMCTHKRVTATVATVLMSAIMFGAIHLLRPGTSWKEVSIISAVGTIYGFIRMASGSSATAAVAHALYNVTLHIGTVAPS
jgi:membrane protease YdiL (CAAX protease family)